MLCEICVKQHVTITDNSLSSLFNHVVGKNCDSDVNITDTVRHQAWTSSATNTNIRNYDITKRVLNRLYTLRQPGQQFI